MAISMSHYRVWAAFDVSVVTRQTILFRNWWCFIASAPQETPRFCIQHLVNPSLPFNTGTGGKTCIYYLFRLYVHSILKGQTGRELKKKNPCNPHPGLEETYFLWILKWYKLKHPRISTFYFTGDPATPACCCCCCCTNPQVGQPAG